MNNSIEIFLLAGVFTTIFMYIMESVLMMNVYSFKGMTIIISLSAIHTYVGELIMKRIKRRYEEIQE